MDLNAPLVFREIKYGSEGVVDEEGEPVIEPKPKKPGLFSRAKAAMTDNVSRAKKLIPRDPAADLKECLRSLSAIRDRWNAIKAEYQRKSKPQFIF